MMKRLSLGMKVKIPWGLEDDRDGTIVEVWGDPSAPTQIRVKLAPAATDDESVVLLLSPSVVKPVPAA